MATTNKSFRTKQSVISEGNVEAAGVLISSNSATNEGGEIQLALPSSGSTLSTGIIVDVYQNRLRFFESGGTNRGAYIDLSAASSGVGSNLLSSGGGTTTNALTIGTGLSGTSFNGSAAVTIANTGVLSVNGSTGAITGIATTAGNLSQFAATTSAQLAGVISDETGSGSLVFATSPTLVTPILGTPTSVTLTNATGLPISTGVSGLGTGVATLLATPSSANLAAAITDETGSGSLVFGTSPSLTTPTIGGAGANFSGSVSGTTNLRASSAAGTTTITLPAVTGTVVTTGDTGTVTSTMIADGTIVNADINASAAIAVSKLSASTISGVTLGNNLNSLTIGTGLSGTSYNGSSAVTIAINSTVATLTGAQTLTNKTLGSSTTLGADLAAGTYKITGLGTPTASTDAATKQYVDDVAQGLHIHASVVAATTANLTATYSNGTSGVGATLTNSGTLAAFSSDGVSPAQNDRVLVKNQTTQLQNGIYTLTTVGSASVAWVLTRATDMDQSVEIDGGDFVFVTSGSTLDNTGWVQTETGVTVGTSSIIFTQFSGAGTYIAGNGLTLTGSTFSINTSITADLSTAQTLTNKTLTSPTLTTPSIGVATGTSFNSITGLSSTTPSANGTAAVGTATTTARADHVHPTTGLGLTASGLNQFAATTSAQLAGVISDETGSGALVFATSPTLVTPNIGVATGTSFNSITGLSSTTPGANAGSGSVGTSTTVARADHTHPAVSASSAGILNGSDGTTVMTGANAVSTSGGRGVNLAPSTYGTQLNLEFKNTSFYAGSANYGGGNYRGLLTIAPWVGTTASTGDPNYQMMFVPQAANSTAQPVLLVRAGIDSTWGPWAKVANDDEVNIMQIMGAR